jgi:hypothetical protein
MAKKVLYGFLILSNLLAVYLYVANFFMTQYAWKRCVELDSTRADMVLFVAYCGKTIEGNSYLVPLVEIEDYVDSLK